MDEMIKDKRQQRSKEERVAEIDEKINGLNQALDDLENKRDNAIAAFDAIEKIYKGEDQFSYRKED